MLPVIVLEEINLDVPKSHTFAVSEFLSSYQRNVSTCSKRVRQQTSKFEGFKSRWISAGCRLCRYIIPLVTSSSSSTFFTKLIDWCNWFGTLLDSRLWMTCSNDLP